MAAKAAIHALLSISFLLDVICLGRQEGVDGRFRGHDGLQAREGQHA